MIRTEFTTFKAKGISRKFFWGEGWGKTKTRNTPTNLSHLLYQWHVKGLKQWAYAKGSPQGKAASIQEFRVKSGRSFS